MVEWSCSKERINEREPYIFAEWSCVNKWNKSVGTLSLGRMVVHKGKINEKGPYSSVEWSCAHGGNKSMRTLNFGRIIVHKWAFSVVWAHYPAHRWKCRGHIFAVKVNKYNVKSLIYNVYAMHSFCDISVINIFSYDWYTLSGR